MNIQFVTQVLISVEHWLRINHKIDDQDFFVELFLEQFSSHAHMCDTFDKYSLHAQDILGTLQHSNKRLKK